ncbi:hypothetical protein TNCV_4156701 [Trichonephila clavipes]|nr:hypothetical protein TNCV_4156701 [Trichonephila clavipes]
MEIITTRAKTPANLSYCVVLSCLRSPRQPSTPQGIPRFRPRSGCNPKIEGAVLCYPREPSVREREQEMWSENSLSLSSLRGPQETPPSQTTELRL